jgi:hypothetical protein
MLFIDSQKQYLITSPTFAGELIKDHLSTTKRYTFYTYTTSKKRARKYTISIKS